jgi:hypothetical protein
VFPSFEASSKIEDTNHILVVPFSGFGNRICITAGARRRMMTTQGTAQRTEGEGRAPEHTHVAETHGHDHYHVSHHHRSGVEAVAGDFEHRTYWHTHDHNHTTLTHSHDYSEADENQHHAREAHVHDHAAPAQSPA